MTGSSRTREEEHGERKAVVLPANLGRYKVGMYEWTLQTLGAIR